MSLSDELRLSYYQPVADIHARHGVKLVQHTSSGKFYVAKKLTVYSLPVFQYLQEHPVKNTPRIIELSEENQILTVIEEYLPGDSLQVLLDEQELFSEEQVISLTLQLTGIVRQLHHAPTPIIHRDIKPSNLILSTDGILKLIDFNAAKFVSDEQCRDTVNLGTYGFAAPEQYGFAASNTQTDIYAIGILMNVLLTGALPSEKSVDGRLAPLIAKCTQMDPKNRFSDIDVLRDVLHKLQTENIPSVDIPDTDSQETTNIPENHFWHRFLPPGFRSGSPLRMLTAVCGYAFLFYVGVSMQVESASYADIVLNRAAFIIAGLLIIFFSTDYIGIQSHFPFMNTKNRMLRLVFILLYDLLILFAVVFLLVILESFL